jgi:hypothetical protein
MRDDPYIEFNVRTDLENTGDQQGTEEGEECRVQMIAEVRELFSSEECPVPHLMDPFIIKEASQGC